MRINFLKDKTVLITGHTGFKGIWLSIFCTYLGAKVIGISKDIKNNKVFFDSIRPKLFRSFIFDLRNFNKTQKILKKYKPKILFHLAADALVIESYKNPHETFSNNIISSLNLLEICRRNNIKTSIIFITSDKSYKNVEKKKGYLETDELGGSDPYSGSKASIEMIINSYFKSYFSKNISLTKIAVCRAGNVIGGGDFSENRIIPDAFRNWKLKKNIIIRNPLATRPWQHVIEPIYGYILLAKHLSNKKINGQIFNFGPSNRKHINTITLIKKLNKISRNFIKDGSYHIKRDKKKYYEANLLYLNSNKVKNVLGWKCILNLNETLKYTSDWYINYYNKNEKLYYFSINQIKNYLKNVKNSNT